jgi:hypothetical protein
MGGRILTTFLETIAIAADIDTLEWVQMFHRLRFLVWDDFVEQSTSTMK